jgi:hypothetical protein
MSSQLIRQDLVPIVAGYLLLMGALALGLRFLRRSGGESLADRKSAGDGEPAADGGSPGGREPAVPVAPASRGLARLAAAWRRPGWLRLIRHLASTATGGYLLLMAIVLLYYYGVAKVAGSFLDSAVTGCALLIGLSAPVFIAASWLAERGGRRAARRAAGRSAGRAGPPGRGGSQPGLGPGGT